MTRVRKVYGDAALAAKGFAEQELGALEKAFVALSNRYGVTIEETTNIAAEWAAAGASGLALAKSVKLTMETMILGELDAAKATEALIAIQAQYRFDTNQLADTMARLNAIENETGTKTADLIDAMSRAAGVAREAGVSVAELGGMVAALTPAAGSAAQAGNALKTIISRLLAPTGDAADLMTAMGLAVEEQAWQSMTATARMETLADSYDGLTDSQKNVVSAYVASRYQINKFSVLMEAMHENQSYYNKALAVAGDNADYFSRAATELNTVLDSNPQKVKQAGVMLQNSMVKIIQPLLPLIVGLAQELAQAATAISNMNPEMLKFISIGLVLLAMLGMVARYVGSMATLISVLGRAFTGIRPMIAGAATGFGLFGKKAHAELDDVANKGPGKLRTTLTAMRAQVVAGAPWLVAPFTKMKVAIWVQFTLLKEGVLARIALMRAAVIFNWNVMFALMRASAVARIAQIQALIAANLLPGFMMTLSRLRGLALVHWLGMWATMQLMAGLSMVNLRARWAAFGVWWLGAQVGLHARVLAIWAAAGARLAPLWAAVQTAVIRVQMAASSAMAVIHRVFQRGIIASTVRFGAILPMLWAQVWGGVQRIWYASLLILNKIGLVFGRGYAAATAALGRVLNLIWMATFGGAAKIFTMGFRALFMIGTAGGALLARGWAAAGMAMNRMWGALLIAMRAQWIAFIMFMRTPGMLLGVFKSMGGAIMAGGRGIMAVLAALRTGIIALLTSPWGIAIAIVIGLIILFRDQLAKVWTNIQKYFQDANNNIVKAFDALPNGIKNVFLKVIAVVKAAAMKVYEWMQYLNPFARHSPSLVDNVTAGLAVVRGQFGTLTQVAGPVNTAYAAIQRLKDVSASLREGAASIKIAEQIKELAQYAPGVIPAFRELSNHLIILQQKADELEKVINKQEQTVRLWKAALDASADALQDQKDKLDALQKVADSYEDSISALREEIDALASTPLTGMGAMADAIFENEMAQKRLRLEIMNLEDAGHSYDDVKNKIASLAGEIENLRGTQADLRSAGAGSEILGFYDQQIAALEAQQKATEEQAGPINEAQKALEDLERQATRMDLEQSLAFDPLTRQIDQAANSMKEMPFDQIIGQIQQNQRELVPLEAAWEQANQAVTRQQAVVDQAQAAHDQIQASFDAENEKLQILKDAYGEVSSAIGDVNSAMSDMNAAISAGGRGEGALSPAMESFNAAAGGGDFADVGGDSIIGRFTEGNETADIDAFTKDIEDQLANSFGGMDMFGPFKDMWEGFKKWWEANVTPWFGPIGDFFSTIFEDVDFLKPIRDIWADVGSIFTETDWEGIVTDVWNSVSTFFGHIWDFVEIFQEILGPDVMETFNIIGDSLKEWWQAIVDAFTGGEIGSAIDALTGAFDAFWGFVFPILKTLWAVFLMVVQVIWSAVNGVLAPTLDWIGAMFGNIWDIIVGFWNVIAGIFTGDWKRVWDGVKSIFSGAWGLIWDTIKWVGLAIWGFIKGFVSGIWDNIEWVWGKIVEFATWIGGLFVKGFESAITAIGNAWDTIKEKMRAPVKWVVDFVWNDGLRKLWNKVSGLWGGDPIDRFDFARGGVMPGYTPGRDVHQFFSPTGGLLNLSGGEGILRPEATRAIGGAAGVETINKAARTGGVDAVRDLFSMEPQYFANGGIVSIPGWLDTVLRFVPGTGVIKDVIDSINSGQSGSGEGLMGSGLLKIPGEILEKIWDKVKAWWDDDNPKSEGGIEGVGSGTQVQRMFRAVQTVFPRARLNSGQRNTNDMHGRGKAIDLGEQGFAGGAGRPYLAEMAAWIYKHVANISELIYNGIGASVSNVKNGRNFPYSASTQRDHLNHAHWGQDRFDDGGIMAHGRGGFNTSGRPERVLTPRQTETFDRLLSFLEETGIPSPAAMEGAIFRATVKANRAEAIGGQTIVNGDLGTTNITNNFYGDLSFPNITSGDDAETFLQNLGDLAGAR